MKTLKLPWHTEEYSMPVLWDDSDDNDGALANIYIECINCKYRFYGHMHGMMDLFHAKTVSCMNCMENQI